MSKAALREKRRAERIAKRRRQRTILGIIIVLVVIAGLAVLFRRLGRR